MDSVERQLRAYYEAEARAGLRPQHNERRRAICEAFAHRLGEERRLQVLDVGAGPASDREPFAACGVRYVGLDLAIGNSVIAATLDQAVVPASLFQMPFADRTFSAGWSMSTFQHVTDERIDEALAEFVRVLVPGAPVMIGLWGGRNEIVESASSTSRLRLPRHFTLRSHQRIRSILGRHLVIEWDNTFASGASDWEYHVSATHTPELTTTRE